MYNKTNDLKSNFIILLLPTIYTLILILAFPVDDTIIDRGNYLNYAAYSSDVMERYSSIGILNVIFNEPIWLFMNISLSSFLSPENVVRVFICFSSWVGFYVCLKNNSKHILLIILIFLFPQVMKNYVIHLRQGVAITFFIIAYYRDDGLLRRALFMATPFIHLSFFFVILIYGLSLLLLRIKFSRDISAAIVIAVGMMIAFSLKLIATVVGSRQANEYDFTSANVSGIAFFFWGIFFILYWLQGKEFCRRYCFQVLGILFYLSTYFFIEVTARIFESYIIFVLIACCYLTQYRKLFFVSVLVLFIASTYIFRLGLPYIGWGVIQ
ncbi:EpsG family protein [Aeromonas veronii]